MSLVLPLAPRRRPRVRSMGAPLDPPPRERNAPDAGAPDQRPNGGSGGRPRFVLLIVDDDPLMTEMLPRRMRRVLAADVSIVTADTPEAAVDAILHTRPDAIVSDYNLRKAQTGLDVLGHARELAPEAVRILFSAHSRAEIAGLSDADIHGYLEKPMRLDDLVDPLLEIILARSGVDLRGGGA